MENNNNGNKGVFPGVKSTPVPPTGTIQPGPTIQSVAKTVGASQSNLSHHDTTSVVSQEFTQEGEPTTYIKLETKNTEEQVSGIIEVDLISFRERGQESRFLSVNTTGSDAEGKLSTTTINIDNEADFNRFKKFISQLNWND